jgi:predicted flap endonuclease-1-like 5' DNA nuclease
MHAIEVTGALLVAETDDVYELQDHEFTLEPDGAERDSGVEVSAVRERVQVTPPPLPRASLQPDARGARPQAGARPQLAERSLTRRHSSGVFELGEASIEQLDSAALRLELKRTRALLRAREGYVRQLQEALEASTRRMVELGESSGRNSARLLGRVRGQAYRIAELEAELATRAVPPLAAQPTTLPQAQARASAELAQPAVRTIPTPVAPSLAANPSAAQPTAADDLQRIRGIGPRFASILRGLGVHSCAQLADWSDAEVSRFAAQLRIARGRIERERWVAQAQNLARPAAE